MMQSIQVHLYCWLNNDYLAKILKYAAIYGSNYSIEIYGLKLNRYG